MNRSNTAAARHLSSCHLCLRLDSSESHRCPRCGAALHQRKTDSLNRTLALLATACVLYIPANMLPIMITEQLGSPTASTILGGVVLLINLDSIAIAAVIFFASVMVPVGKILTMTYLCWTIKRGSKASARHRTIAYRITEVIGKWSMIDVFVVAILVALVNVSGILVIYPGPGALAFAALVITTIIAADSFDPRIFWDQQVTEND